MTMEGSFSSEGLSLRSEGVTLLYLDLLLDTQFIDFIS